MLQNQPRKGEVDEEERIRTLEFMKDNIKAEINVVNGKKINEVKKDFDEKMSKFENLEKVVTNLKNNLENNVSQIQKVFSMSNENIQKIQSFSSKFQEFDAINQKFDKLKKEFSSFRDRKGEDKDTQNEMKKILSSINQESEKFEGFKSDIDNSLKNFEKLQNSKVKTLEEQIQKILSNPPQAAQVNSGDSTPRNGPANPNFNFQQALVEMRQTNRKAINQSESNSYRLDTLRYDLDLIKDDIVRQRRAQGEYLSRLTTMENKVDSGMFPKDRPSTSSSTNDRSSGGNFMSNYSNTYQHSRYQSLADFALKGTPAQDAFKKSQDFDEGESFLKKFNSNNNPDFDMINLSMINKNEESEIMNRTDMDLAQFMINSGLKKPSANPTPKKQRHPDVVNTHHVNFESKDSLGQTNLVIPEHPADQEISAEKVRDTPSVQETAKKDEGDNFMTGEEGSKKQENLAETPNPSQEANPEEPENSVIQKLEEMLQGPSGDENSQPASQRQSPSPNKHDTSLNQSFRLKTSVIRQSVRHSLHNSILDNDLEGDTSLTLQVDDEGFLLDKDGYPILGDDGNPIKLTDDNIEFFKENNLYIEQEVQE